MTTMLKKRRPFGPLLSEHQHAAAGALLEDAEADAPAYLDFPAEHRRRIRANNVRERMNGEMKRRSRAVQVFPSPELVLHLAGAACAEQDEDRSSGRCISPESVLRLAEPAGPGPVESEASRRRGLMIVETAMGLAGTGRRAARCYDADGFWRRPVPERRVTPTFSTLPQQAYQELTTQNKRCPY